ncbi:hypothetical protein RCCGEPOP_03231 [Rhizobium sp. Pop5]|nr:hypothetical protein RCCGEPOP_03231 [Rhizobium sp. Pop5]
MLGLIPTRLALALTVAGQTNGFVRGFGAISIDRFVFPNSLCEEQSLYAIDVEDALGNQSFPLPPDSSVVVFLGCEKPDH